MYFEGKVEFLWFWRSPFTVRAIARYNVNVGFSFRRIFAGIIAGYLLQSVHSTSQKLHYLWTIFWTENQNFCEEKMGLFRFLTKWCQKMGLFLDHVVGKILLNWKILETNFKKWENILRRFRADHFSYRQKNRKTIFFNAITRNCVTKIPH